MALEGFGPCLRRDGQKQIHSLQRHGIVCEKVCVTAAVTLGRALELSWALKEHRGVEGVGEGLRRRVSGLCPRPSSILLEKTG